MHDSSVIKRSLRAAEAGLAERRPKAEIAEALVTAHAIAARLGAVPLATAVESLARRARVPLDAPDATPEREALPLRLGEEYGLRRLRQRVGGALHGGRGGGVAVCDAVEMRRRVEGGFAPVRRAIDSGTQRRPRC